MKRKPKSSMQLKRALLQQSTRQATDPPGPQYYWSLWTTNEKRFEDMRGLSLSTQDCHLSLFEQSPTNQPFYAGWYAESESATRQATAKIWLRLECEIVVLDDP